MIFIPRRPKWGNRRLGPICALLTLLTLGQAASPYSLRTASQSPEPSIEFGRLIDRFVAAAVERTHHVVRYDPAYVRIPYPGGDVPAGTGSAPTK